MIKKTIKTLGNKEKSCREVNEPMIKYIEKSERSGLMHGSYQEVCFRNGVVKDNHDSLMIN